MKTKIFFFLSFITLLISCDKVKFYDKFDADFPSNRWKKMNQKTYDFSISDETKLYNLTFRFSHVYDYQFTSVPIAVKITDPSGKEEKIKIDLKIKDASGKQLADCAGDVCDLNYKIKEKAKLLKGDYKITISNSFNGPYLPNVLGVGLKVEIAE